MYGICVIACDAAGGTRVISCWHLPVVIAHHQLLMYITTINPLFSKHLPVSACGF
jgi:hypothetical protein